MTGAARSLAAVRATSSDGTFPVSAVRGAGCESAAVFFAAAFHGRQDAAFLALDCGIGDGMLVDVDAEKLGEMREVYPSGWRIRVGPAEGVAAEFAAAHRMWDVVTCDPWTGYVAATMRRVPLWASVSRRVLVLGVARPWFEAEGVLAAVPDLGAWVGRTFPGLPWRGVELVRRSDHLGGVWWYVMERVGAVG